MTTTRLEAFSDGVIAIAITLLVIEIHPPELDGRTLAAALWDQWPTYLAYVLAFAQLGVIWLNHHRIFQQVQVVDGPLLLLNLNLLLWVVLIPFPTAVVADFVQDGGEPARTAVALFSAVLLACAISFSALYLWITHDDQVLGTPLDPAVARRARLRFSLGLGVYAAAVALSFVAPVAVLVLHALTAAYYAFDQATVASGEDQPAPRPA